MDNWTDLLEISFGLQDQEFGGHALERKNTRAMLEIVVRDGVLYRDVEAAARALLTKRGCTAPHIEKQMKNLYDLRSYVEE